MTTKQNTSDIQNNPKQPKTIIAMNLHFAAGRLLLAGAVLAGGLAPSAVEGSVLQCPPLGQETIIFVAGASVTVSLSVKPTS